MFDRRAKIFLSILVLTTLVLLARVMQIQLLNQGHWESEAIDLMSTGELVETTRGRILDRNGNPMAIDAPCTDAAVDFRAILFEPDEKWVRETAIGRLRSRMGESYRTTPTSRRSELIQQETAAVLSDIKAMWKTLADVGGLTRDQMDDLRLSIIQRVDIRRRRVWYGRYQRAVNQKSTTQPASWYARWLLDESQQMPEVDQFFEPIFEELEPHVILSDISNSTYNFLGKNRERFPGLVLRPSVHRRYPYNDVAAHVIGHLGRVTREDIRANRFENDELREYQLNDLVGRTGLESLCEVVLRGTRGKIERFLADSPRETRVSESIQGDDVFCTLDMDLQADIQQIFKRVEVKFNDALPIEKMEMPGGAVLLDVKTNQVLALVSYPSYDLNEFDERYSEWVTDEINRRLNNRATQFALEPGSTVKPIVGLGAITQGLFGLHETVECTGYLVLGGRQYSVGRCWTMSSFGALGFGHHLYPVKHPTGFLDFSDGLERSCNVFFETIADRLGINGLAYWYHQFGLGEPTGLGIPESSGMIPGDRTIPAFRQRAAAWFSGIGQDQVLATPIQMANVAATIARDGVWMRPRLLLDEKDSPMTAADRGPDRDLQLSKDALAEAKEGMRRVVNDPAGTGNSMKMEHLTVAGKTGSAQAAPLKIPMADETGKVRWEALVMGTYEQPNPLAPWYRGHGPNQDRRSHAWVIGYAPADDPKLAFAVMVEYGGSGGQAAGGVARQMLEACMERGYLPRK